MDFEKRDADKEEHGETIRDMQFIRQFASMFKTEFSAPLVPDIRRVA